MDSQQNAAHQADAPNSAARTHPWRPFILSVLGMASFWQLLRYRNLSALVSFWIDPASGISWGYAALLVLTGLLCIGGALFSRRLSCMAQKPAIIMACSLCATVMAFLDAYTQSYADFGIRAALVLQVLCLPLYAATFVGVVGEWSLCLGRFLPDIKGIALVVLASSAATLVYTLASSFETVPSYLVRAFQPVLCALFCVLLQREAGECHRDISTVQGRRTQRYAPFVLSTIALLASASIMKGLAGDALGNFIDSPQLPYSQLVTLAFGIVGLVALIWARRSVAFAYASLVILAGCLVLGLLTLGFAESGAYPLAFALIAADRAWVEAFLFGIALCTGSPGGTVRRACLVFAFPDIACSLLRRVALPWIAAQREATLEELAPAWGTALGIAVLTGCCLVLAWSVLTRVNREDGPLFAFAPGSLLLSGVNPPYTAPTAANSSSACDVLCHQYGLTPKESVILDRLLRGYSIPDIAARESISDSTVRTHYRNIYAKLGIHSKTELIELAERCQTEEGTSL